MLLYTSGGVDALVAVAVAVALGLPNNLFSPIIAVFILFSFLFFFFLEKRVNLSLQSIFVSYLQQENYIQDGTGQQVI